VTLDWRPSVVPEQPSPGEAGEPPSPPSRRRMLVIGAALLALAGALVAVVVIGGGRGRHPAAALPPPPPVPSQSTASSPVVAPPAASSPTDRDLSIPLTTPAGLTWSLWHGEWEPYSRTAGPAHVAGAVAAGYARTPLGALVAAQQIGTRYLISPNGGWRTVTLAQVLPGTGRDRFLAARVRRPAGRRPRTAGRVPLRLMDPRPGRAPGRRTSPRPRRIPGDHLDPVLG